MSEHLLAVTASPGRHVPARIAGLVLPSDIEVSGLQFSRPPGPKLWWIQMTVRVPCQERLELLVKRLNRLVEVLRVVCVEPDGHLRQSVYVRLRPDAGSLAPVGELTRWFRAEILELNKDGLVLHLAAAPDRCAAFVSLLRPHGIVEVTTTALSGFRVAKKTISHVPRPAAREFSQR
ncbi:hypothetical protein AB0878_45640 [Amycolatopsis sp. NPDC047767]|uniref:hypothetical protein n=1 Tax=Amycolatopsis sp. NPDC047767 TaxID=3156765 RepID=UPI003454F222